MINDESSGHLDSLNVRNTGARRTIRIFAIFAATIMLLMVFQVLAMPAFADDTTPDLPLSGTNPIDNSSSIPNLIDTIQSISNSHPESGLQSFGGPQVTISDIGTPVSIPVMKETRDQISIRSSYGTYIINKSAPAILRVTDENDNIVVRESYFALRADNLALSTSDSKELGVVMINNEALTVRYNLTDSNGKYVGRMEMRIDYNETTPPKITASVLDVSSSLTGWSVYWQIAPLQDAMLRYDSLNMSLPLSAITGARPDSGELSTTVVGTSIDGSVATPVRMDINWSDAKSGLLNVQYSKLLSGEGGYTLQIQFDKSQSVIDPTIVVSGSISKSLSIMSQRKTFWYDGTYWVFYYTGTAICCKSSFDGNTWGSQQTVYTTTIAKTLSGLPTGFDVAQKGNTVAIAWTEDIAGQNEYLYFMNGTISYGVIKWNQRIPVYTLVQAPSPVSIAIGTDDSYWIASQTINSAPYRFDVYHAMPGSSTFILECWDYALGGDVTGTFFVLPMANSRIALLEACFYRADVRVRYWCSPGWTTADLETPGGDGLFDSYPSATFQNISAVATLDGTIYIAYKNHDGNLGFAKYTPSIQSWEVTTIRSVSIEYPSISLDGNNNLHICYRTVSGSVYSIKHIEKPLSASQSSWTGDDLIYFIPSTVIKDITTWISPVGHNCVIWTNMIGPNIQFASFPIPFGSAGASVDPWNREGLSPYGSFFSSFSSSVSPGTGLLTIQQNDANIPGRDGIDLGISRLYMEPKYFWKNGTPYMAPKYPFCNLGLSWSLDLPWFDGTYVGLPGGLRFVVRWGNFGNPLEFDNHDIVHFTFRSFYAHHGQYSELITASGVRYLFVADGTGSNKLIEISDLKGFTLGNTSGGYSRIYLLYDASGRLQYMQDSALSRLITFTYDANGLLNATTFPTTLPDALHVNFNYVPVSGGYALSKVFDQKGRRTQYEYVTSDGCVLLNRTTLPTNGRIEYGYTKDSTAGTEVVSWLVTSVVTKNVTGGLESLIRYSTFFYRIVNGYITNSNQTDLNENRVIQSFTDYIFRSAMKCLIVSKRTSGGVQLLKTVTWFDTVGQPVKTDTYRGNTDQVTYSEYIGYDHWGNMIFTRDATGQESYSAYSNTNNNNSFKGGSKFTLTSSGKIFFDAFDSWNISSWGKITTTGTVSLDGGAYPPRSPSLKIDRTSAAAGDNYAYRGIGSQSSDFIMQFSFMTSTLTYSYFLGRSGGHAGAIRLYASAYNGAFHWYDGADHSVGSYKVSVWYDMAFYVHPASNKFDIYVNGTRIFTGANLNGASGNIDTLTFNAGSSSGGATTTLWIDNVRVFKSLTISLTFPTVYGNYYTIQLFDSKSKLVNTTRTLNAAVIGIPPRSDVPPCFIKVLIPGRNSFETPIMEIWGGDSYTVTLGYSSAEITKDYYGNGYLKSIIGGNGNMADEGWPTGYVEYKSPNDQYEGKWVTSYADAASADKYHENKYANGTHYHGFKTASTSQMTVLGTDLLVNYIWLTDGKLPREIMIQYFEYVYGEWYRAYWGGSDTTGADLMDLSGANLQPSSDHIRRIGDIPQTTGRWIQLIVKASDIFEGGTSDIRGEIFGLYDGAARWDFSSKQLNGISFSGLSGGQTVKMTFLNGTVVTGAGTLYPYNAGMYTFPAQARIQILSGSTVLYTSSVIDEVMNSDAYTYSASSNSFYPMTIRGDLHVLPVASRGFQDALRTVCQESYVKYSYEGDAIETKSRLGSGWVYSQAGYDMYGNQLWAADQTGRMTVNEYSSSNYNTYPIATRYGGRQDVFDFDTSWQSYASASWLNAKYTTANYYSSNQSLQTEFYQAPGFPADTGNSYIWKEYKVNPIANLSVRFYVNHFWHDHATGETLDAGIRIRLYNSGGSNYKTYEYWIASWSGINDYRTGYSNVKVIYSASAPPLGVWTTLILNPSSTTTGFGIDWSNCDKVRFEFYTNTTKASGDHLKIYYDDFAYDDFASTGIINSRTVYTYNNPNGTLASVRDPCGNVTSYVYDNLGRVKKIVYPDSTNTTYIYDDAANKVTVLDELNQKTVSYYDTIGRQYKTERYGTGSTMYSRELMTYNWLDKVATQTNARGYTYTMSYDCLGRLIKVTDPNGSVSTVSYDMISNTVNYTDAIGHSTVKVFDILGRLNSTREYYSPSAYYTTLNAYDAVGNLLTVKTSNGQVTRMAYDSLNRLTSTTYPDTYSESATYDEAGRPVTKTGRDGITSSFYYDTSGRLLRLVNPSDTISYTYNAVGQEMKVKNSLVTISYAYDVRGRLKSVYEPLETAGATYFTYDKAGNLKTLKYPNSVLITYNYDKYNRPTQVVYSGITLLTFTYNLDDSEATCTDEYGFVTTYTYDNLGRTTRILTMDGGTTVLSLTYSYDRVGNVRSINAENYTYDWLNRLTRAVGPWGTILYGYDSVGNQLWKNENSVNITYQYGAYNKLISNSTGGNVLYSFAYNRYGDLIWKNASTIRWNYVFNSMHQLTQVVKWTQSGGSVTVGTYSYDGAGARARVKDGTTYTNSFYYLGHDPIYSHLDRDLYCYVYVNGRLRADINGNSEDFYFSDILGGVRSIYWDGALKYKVQSYKPFGGAYGVTDSFSGAYKQRFKFAGEINDEKAGLYYLSARYYDPDLGRFLSLDPKLGKLSVPQTLNRYVYCANNPLNRIDPTGEFWNILIGAVAGAIIGGVIAAVTGGDVLAGVAGGLVGGAIAGATCGASLLVTGAVYGATSSFTSTMIETRGDIGASLTSAAIGGIIGGITGGVASKIGTAFSKIAAGKIASKYGGNVIKVLKGDTFSRTFNMEANNAFGKSGGVGFFAKGNTLFKNFGSTKDIEDLTGPLFSKANGYSPNAAGMFEARGNFYAVERSSQLGGGTIGSEIISPTWASKIFLRMSEIAMFGS
jgi:RHS repeat-associated protein